MFVEEQENSRGLQASRASPGLLQKAQLGAYAEQTQEVFRLNLGTGIS